MKKHPRLAQTFALRTNAAHLKQADIWIQAASAGEAFLAICLLQHLSPVRPVRILITTTTDQGMEILTREFEKNRQHPLVSLSLAWFPFDRPDIVKTVVKKVAPRVMILLETELWPALLYFLKQNHTRILVINGRMSRKSGRNYRWTRTLWSRIFPHRILAVSRPDAVRFKQVFPQSDVAVMPNMKFDLATALTQTPALLSIPDLFPPGLAVSVLASVRQPEEKQVLEIIRHLLNRFPDQIVAVFPRHMHRLGSWKRRLKKTGLPFYLRSELSGPPAGSGILLWDRFGEMRSVFTHAHAVFMGGSLTPLGG
ncbi:MAG: 3-deoxy-D-manno-octulosonic acid transferase, partial [Desulfotignum sp.]